MAQPQPWLVQEAGCHSLKTLNNHPFFIWKLGIFRRQFEHSRTDALFAGSLTIHGAIVMDLTGSEGPFSEPEHTTRPHPEATFETISPGQLYNILFLPEGSRSIRLLDLDAPSDPDVTSDNSEPLTAHLRIARLEDSPSFAALSYVWGKKSTTSHQILCHPYGCGIEITANCYAALCQIRKRFGAVTIWVDSVCINQANEVEKARQIPLMREIYSWAEETYIWLGPGNEESYRAMDWMRERSASKTPIPLGLLAAKSERKRREELARFRRNLWRDAICKSAAPLATFGT